MIEKTSPKKNMIYNLIYQMLILIIPFITAPYLARTVGVQGVGTYSYTYTIVYYFMLISMLGINNYGNREIAKNRDNKCELSKTFWGIYVIEFITTILMILLYVIYLFLFCEDYKNIAIIQIVFILSSLFDVNWFFFGMEKFKTTIFRNTLIKILTTVLIFSIVKEENDLWKYTLIMSGMTFISQIILWPQLLKEVNFINIKKINIKKHIKPCLTLFIPVIAISIYKLMDKIMLGILSEISDVGLYDSGEKIISICFTVVNALGTVMLPRISNLIANGEKTKINDYIKKSTKFIMFITFPMCFGLITISNDFTFLYYGKEFEATGMVIKLLAITIPVASWSTIIRTQYLVPNEKDKEYLKSVCIGAIVNIICNIVLIPKYGCIGACFGTIIAEILVMSLQTSIVMKELKVQEFLKDSLPFLYKSIIMVCIINVIGLMHINRVLILFLQLIIGVIIYGVLNIKFILNIINFNNIKNKIYSK